MNDYGVENSGFITFKTGLISTSTETIYNNQRFKLVVVENEVQMIANETNVVASWTIHSITQTLKRKNSSLSGINKVFVKSLVESGRLGVKFNVMKKDHGTMWSIIRTKGTTQAVQKVQALKTLESPKEAFEKLSNEIFYKINLFGQTYSFI
jgi:hypothetical protein